MFCSSFAPFKGEGLWCFPRMGIFFLLVLLPLRFTDRGVFWLYTYILVIRLTPLHRSLSDWEFDSCLKYDLVHIFLGQQDWMHFFQCYHIFISTVRVNFVTAVYIHFIDCYKSCVLTQISCWACAIFDNTLCIWWHLVRVHNTRNVGF